MTALRDNPNAALVGMTTLVFSVLYLVSDVIEALQGGFSAGQLVLTLIAEAAIPVIVIGLYLVQRPQIGRLGQLSAAAYAYSYVFFTGTVVYALIDGTSDYTALSRELQPWMTIHGAVMVLAGLGFGVAVIRANVLPRWTGIALMAGVVLVSLSQTLPEGAQLLAAAIRDIGFAGMGAALLGVHSFGSPPGRVPGLAGVEPGLAVPDQRLGQRAERPQAAPDASQQIRYLLGDDQRAGAGARVAQARDNDISATILPVPDRDLGRALPDVEPADLPRP